jgi:hypothetical protein
VSQTVFLKTAAKLKRTCYSLSNGGAQFNCWKRDSLMVVKKQLLLVELPEQNTYEAYGATVLLPLTTVQKTLPD